MKRSSKILSLMLAGIMVLSLYGCTGGFGQKPGNGVSEVDNVKNQDNTDKNKEEEKTTEPEKEENKGSEENKEQKDTAIGSIKTIGVNGSYEYIFKGTGQFSDKALVKGNGKRFQLITASGAGQTINVYEVSDDKLTHIYSKVLSDEESNNLEKVDYLSVKPEKNTVMLKAPLKKGTSWENKEVVEAGENLKLNGVTLKGKYFKTWEKEEKNGDKIVKVYCFSEGLGIVRYMIQLNGVTMEEAVLSGYTKK